MAQTPKISLIAVSRPPPPQDDADKRKINTYELGSVEITAPQAVDANPTVNVISIKDIKEVGAKSAAEAIMRSTGIFYRNAGDTGTSEVRNVYIRGYNSRHHGLFLDGIPVINFYDRVTDYNQFATQGVSSIQISKGFTSPAYGATTMGGAINIVSHKPQKELEISLHHRNLGKDITQPAEIQQGLSIGTRQDKFYLQIDASNVNKTIFHFSKSYKDTAEAQKGYKENAAYQNQTLKLKAGFMPNENHEYSLNYVRSVGLKDEATSVRTWRGTTTATTTTWPIMRKNTLYLLGNSYFTPYLSLDSKLYYDNFYRDFQTESCNLTTGAACTYSSGIYRQDSYGGIFTLNYDIADRTNLKVGTNLKREHHRGTTESSTAATLNQDLAEFYTSLFAQIAQGIGNFRLVVAASYDRVDPIYVDYVQSANYTTKAKGDAKTEQPVYPGYSLQGIVYYDFAPNNSLHLTVGKKQNIQGMGTRYTSSWYMYIPSPELKPESAINYELGYDLSYKSTVVSAALYFNDMYRIIKSKKIPSPDVSTGNALCLTPQRAGYPYSYSPYGCYQMYNAGKGYTYGFELSVEQGFFGDILTLGANYTYAGSSMKDRELSHGDNTTMKLDIGSKMQYYPNHFFNAKVAVKPIKDLSIMGFVSLQDKVYFAEYDENYNLTGYGRGKNYFTLDLAASYHIGKGFSVNAGAYNVTDRDNYSDFDDYHYAGRRFYVGVEYNY